MLMAPATVVVLYDGHGVQPEVAEVAPDAVEYVPTPQSAHVAAVVAPTRLEYSPAPHS